MGQDSQVVDRPFNRRAKSLADLSGVFNCKKNALFAKARPLAPVGFARFPRAPRRPTGIPRPGLTKRR